MGKKKRWGKNFCREWRESKGLSLEEVAAAIGSTHATISRIETGKLPYSQEKLESLARVYRCEPWEMLAGPPPEPASEIKLTPPKKRRAAA